MSQDRFLVLGAGVFGLAAALELRRTGARVDVLESGEVPHPLAGGTDISKVCRMEYGPDEGYMVWMEAARDGWLEWNRRWVEKGASPLYHETGVLMVALDEMAPGGFEYESFQMLLRRGHAPERLGGAELARRFPAWSEQFVDGFYHPHGGWVESGKGVEAMADDARRDGVEIHERRPAVALLEQGDAVIGVRDATGRDWHADAVVVAAGSWTAELIDRLEPALQRSYHPVWHLEPADPGLFDASRFPVFTADVHRTGFYGFPWHPEAKVVKVAHHGNAVEPPPSGELVVTDALTAGLRRFLESRLPALAGSRVVSTRLCPYCDTQDEDFWIDADPDRSGLVVASGGSGHGMKFAPVLGEAIAAAVFDTAHPMRERFRWRPDLRLEHGREASRCHTEGALVDPGDGGGVAGGGR